MQKENKTGTSKKYPPEFQGEALALAERVGVPAAASELGLSTSQLYRWRARAAEDQAREASGLEQAAEIARLEHRLAEQAQELDILKKAAAYFSNHQS